MNIHAKYIVDENLNKTAVVIPYLIWKKIMEDIEELDDIRAYDNAKHEPGDEMVDFDQAIAEIEAGKVV